MAQMTRQPDEKNGHQQQTEDAQKILGTPKEKTWKTKQRTTIQEKRIEELKRTSDDYKDTLQRLRAELENAGKRMEREKEEFVKFAMVKTIGDFLPIADSIEEGIRQAGKTADASMKEGFERLQKQFSQILEKNGVKRIETAGKKFDHALHEVIMTGQDSTKEDDSILEELQKGYTMNGKVLRPAKVRVNKLG